MRLRHALCMVLLAASWGTISAARAEELGCAPPDGARVLTTLPRVPLQWPARANATYRVDVWPPNQPCRTLVSREGSLVAALEVPGVYQWRVQEIGPQGSRTVVPPRSFVLSDRVRLLYDGRDGGGGDSAIEGPQGAGPRAGLPGEDAAEVIIDLMACGPYVRFTQSAPSRGVLYVARLALPLQISARGGRGGAGGTGYPGARGYATMTSNGAGGTVAWMHPGSNGGDGAPGGAGGRGGAVTVRSDGSVQAARCVEVTAGGGSGGAGGAGGPGGDAPYVPTGQLVVGTPRPGAPGQKGPEGAKGSDGAVDIR